MGSLACLGLVPKGAQAPAPAPPLHENNSTLPGSKPSSKDGEEGSATLVKVSDVELQTQ